MVYTQKRRNKIKIVIKHDQAGAYHEATNKLNDDERNVEASPKCS